jgi:hypothetical protein
MPQPETVKLDWAVPMGYMRPAGGKHFYCVGNVYSSA